MCQHQVTASDIPFYDIFAPTKNSFFEVFDDVIVRDLWFGPPQSKILATPMPSAEFFLAFSMFPVLFCLAGSDHDL